MTEAEFRSAVQGLLAQPVDNLSATQKTDIVTEQLTRLEQGAPKRWEDSSWYDWSSKLVMLAGLLIPVMLLTDHSIWVQWGVGFSTSVVVQILYKLLIQLLQPRLEATPKPS